MEVDIEHLKKIARQMRIDILTMLVEAGSGHTGGSLSAADIITVLYFYKMRHDPKNPKWEERDKFVLSKGHGAPALYAALGRAGYFGIEHFHTLRKMGSILRGHPNSTVTPGVEVCTGSLGQGLSQANGLALAARLDKKSTRVYVMLGDGETDEGQVWEAAMTSAHYKIDNLCAILDNNGLQIDGPNKEVMNIEPIVGKWRSFGWHVIEINGHEIGEIINALNEAERIKGQPTMIIAHTIKGKGVSFMENKVEYHGIAPTKDEYERAMKELGINEKY
ncbi:MAG: transketolase [Nitrospinae bacterium RIFCSPLOWO2_02_39_17]|nr:MAG: transketolase [Nitrospinae bacterium RIFCSPLOWO2_02_39_17]HLA47662.1 transketolase [Nitrospinota bacterium]